MPASLKTGNLVVDTSLVQRDQVARTCYEGDKIQFVSTEFSNRKEKRYPVGN